MWPLPWWQFAFLSAWHWHWWLEHWQCSGQNVLLGSRSAPVWVNSCGEWSRQIQAAWPNAKQNRTEQKNRKAKTLLNQNKAWRRNTFSANDEFLFYARHSSGKHPSWPRHPRMFTEQTEHEVLGLLMWMQQRTAILCCSSGSIMKLLEGHPLPGRPCSLPWRKSEETRKERHRWWVRQLQSLLSATWGPCKSSWLRPSLFVLCTCHHQYKWSLAIVQPRASTIHQTLSVFSTYWENYQAWFQLSQKRWVWNMHG